MNTKATPTFHYALCMLGIFTLPLVSLTAQEVVLVEQGDTMLYTLPSSDAAFVDGASRPWTAPDFDDTTWTSGTYGVGYDAGGMLATEVPDTTRVVLTRVRFDIANLAAVESVHFGADFDDGYVASINGVEVSRQYMPDGEQDFGANADSHESSNGDSADYRPIQTITAAALPELVEGENVLAVGVWNVEGTSSDLALVPYLSINRPSTPIGSEICGELSGDVTLKLADSPFSATCDVSVPAGSSITIEAGVVVYFGDGVVLDIGGVIQAQGTAQSPIVFAGQDGATWDGVTIDTSGQTRNSALRFVRLSEGDELLHVEDTGASEILVEDCAFDDWHHLAIKWDNDANGLILRRCDIGVDTPFASAAHEAINGYRSSAIIEYCTFGRRRGYNDVIDLGNASWGGPVPTIRYNTFLGGDDDAIDFDNSDGWIIGNLVMNHWPEPGTGGSANGGGITGSDGSSTVVANNIVYHCYHGIGYKNGCTPLVVNNLVLDCYVGVTFYKDSCSVQTGPHGILRNNIVWNSEHANLILNGTWFSGYCQDTTGQATADVQYCLIEGGWPGTGNLSVNPGVVNPAAGDFRLSATSPALDAGFGGPFAHTGVQAAMLAALLGVDRAGVPALDLTCIDDTGAGTPTFRDMGALELVPPGPCNSTPVFVRGDSNYDQMIDVSDAVHMLLFFFASDVTGTCPDASDANDDGELNVSDPISLLQYLFRGAAAPPAPYPFPGEDPTSDELDCGA